jgi:hypothetical protein
MKKPGKTGLKPRFGIFISASFFGGLRMNGLTLPVLFFLLGNPSPDGGFSHAHDTGQLRYVIL